MISIPELTARLKESPKTADDIKRIAARVIAMWETWTRRLWNARTGYVETLRLDERYQREAAIWPELKNITALTKVEVWEDGCDVEELEATDYVLVGGKLIRLPTGTWWGTNARLTYDGGYDKDTVPLDIKEALLVQAEFMSVKNKKPRVVIAGVTGTGGSVSMTPEQDVHPLFKKQAQIHRRRGGSLP